MSVHLTVSVIVTLPTYMTCCRIPMESCSGPCLTQTGWLCYSTLVRLPTLGKQTGDTVPTGPTEATDSSLPLLMVNPLQQAATILSQIV